MAEKRDSIRFRKRLRLRFGKESPTTLAYTEDISLSGLFVKSPSVLQPRNRLFIELELPDGEMVAMEGVIMWAKRVPLTMIHRVNKSGMGIRIVKLISGQPAYEKFLEELQNSRQRTPQK